MLKPFARLVVSTLIALFFATTARSQTTIIYSENPAPGDLVTAYGALKGDQIGSSNWHYNWVRRAQVGIRTDFPRNGNGSVYFNVGIASGFLPQAGIVYYRSSRQVGDAYNYATDTSSIIAPLQVLQNVTYSWYRDAASTVADNLFPRLEINIDLDGNPATAGAGYLGLRRPAGAVPVGTWVNESILASGNTLFWETTSGTGINIPTTPRTFADWLSYFQTNFPSAVIVGFTFVAYGESGKVFRGALDDVSWTISGATTSFNFEATPASGGGGQNPVIPEPSTMALFAVGASGLALLRRR